LDTRMTAYKCPHCKGEMVYVGGNEAFCVYNCEICRADLILRVKKKDNILKIAGQDMQVGDNKAYKILKREMNK